MNQPKKQQPLCSVCKIKYKKELEHYRKYKLIDENTVCEECYQELFRLSKAKRKSLSAVYRKYLSIIRKLRFYETKEEDFKYIIYENKKIVSNFKKTIKQLTKK